MPVTNPAPAPAWIDRPDAAADYVARALNHTTVALDTEFIRTQTFHAELGLVQLGGLAGIALVDPLAPGIGSALLPLMVAPGIEKIVHSASEDLEVLRHAFGRVPAPLFDTQIAAVLCGSAQPPSYQKLVQAELGVALDKHATRTDWLKRPLDEEQLRYAAEDVEHLSALQRRQAARLAELGRSAWMAEECARAVARAGQDGEAYPHLKVRGVERMSATGQQRLWRLLNWRDREAAERNRPRRWILDTPVAMRAASLTQPTQAALEAAVAADGKPSPRLAQKLAALLAEPASNTELAIPLQAQASEAEKARVRDLRAHAAVRAGELQLSPEFLLPRRGVEHWARHGQLPEELRGWREAVLGLQA